MSCMRQTTLHIEDMTHDGDPQRVQSFLHRVPGVSIVNVGIRGGEVRVVYDSTKVTPREIQAAVEAAGFHITPEANTTSP